MAEKEITISELSSWTKHLYKFFISKRLLVVLTAFISGILGVLYAWVKDPEYVAEMTFATETASTNLGMYAGIASQFGLDLGGTSSGIFEGESLAELLQSRTMVEKTLLSSNSGQSKELLVESFLNNHNKEWREKEKLNNLEFQHYPQPANRVRDSVISSVIKQITKHELSIDRDKKTTFITITMKDKNEVFAKRFVEVLLDNVIQFYSDYKSKKARQSFEIVKNQTDSVRRILFGNINEVASINDLNVNPLRQIVRTGAQRKQVDVQANAAVYGELLKNLELSRMTLRKETPLIQIIDVPVLPLEKIKPGRLLTGLIFSFVGVFILLFILLFKFISNVPISKGEEARAVAYQKV